MNMIQSNSQKKTRKEKKRKFTYKCTARKKREVIPVIGVSNRSICSVTTAAELLVPFQDIPRRKESQKRVKREK